MLSEKAYEQWDGWPDVFQPPSTCRSELGEILPYASPIIPSVAFWGDEVGNRIDVHYEQGQILFVSVRFDVRTFDVAFLEQVVALARRWEALLLIKDKRILLKPDVVALGTLVIRSGQVDFVAAPKAFLERLHRERRRSEEKE